MKIVVLDGFTENPGDLSWDALAALGDITVYDRTSYQEADIIVERIGDAEIVVMNKTPISRATIDKCPNIKLIAVLATGYNVVDYVYAKEKGIELLCACGELGREMARGAAENGLYFETREEMEAALPEILHQGDVILVKASRGMHMETVAEAVKVLKG